MNDHTNTIFKQLDAIFKDKAQTSPKFILHNGNVYCSYKPHMECYVFYRKNDHNQLISAVYVTDHYRERTEDLKSLETTVLNYLNTKEHMQVTFKTTGIDEAPLRIEA